MAPTLIATTSQMPEKKKKDLEERGAGIVLCPQEDSRVDLPFLMRWLAEQGIDSVLLEGGGSLNFSALRQGIVDKVYAFIAPLIIGGKDAISPVEGHGFEKLADGIRLTIEQVRDMDGDVFIEAYTRRN
jgi:diaminohydroxyphosphoribosylaminopyrimidine deaminase/5-amino-6-(5-phosphoribosylamino)uracil reductase